MRKTIGVALIAAVFSCAAPRAWPAEGTAAASTTTAAVQPLRLPPRRVHKPFPVWLFGLAFCGFAAGVAGAIWAARLKPSRPPRPPRL